MPVLAILGLTAYFNTDEEARKKPLLISAGIVAGILVLLILGNGGFDFTGANDKFYTQQYGPEFMRVLKEDRETLYFSSIYRSFGFLAVAFAALYLFSKKVFSQFTTVILVGLIMVLDLFIVAKHYVKADDFVSKSQIERPFGEPTEADARILEDTTHFRVFEIEGNMSSARASYFHQSIGGYNAVKPRKYQELFDYQIANNNIGVLNMLNTKYIIKNDQEGRPQALENPEANGNAWFVSKVKFVKSADEEMKALTKLNSKEEVVVNTLANDGQDFKGAYSISKDSTSSIQLTSYKPNHLKYVSNNSANGFGVFSEMYYKNGWKATIDGKEVRIYNVDYVLRGLEIPAGKHTIEFKFEPEVVKTGSTIALLSTILVLLGIGLSIFYCRKLNQKSAEVK